MSVAKISYKKIILYGGNIIPFYIFYIFYIEYRNTNFLKKTSKKMLTNSQ